MQDFWKIKNKKPPKKNNNERFFVENLLKRYSMKVKIENNTDFSNLKYSSFAIQIYGLIIFINLPETIEADKKKRISKIERIIFTTGGT